MNERPLFLSWVFFATVILLSSCDRDQSAKVFEKHLADYPGIEKKYIYQSVLRLANINQDPDFDKLIKDVRKITIYFPPSGDSTYQLKELRSTIRNETYEELVDVRTAEKDRISLWVNESLPKPHYIGLLDTSGSDYIFEVDGQIDLEYISSIALADQKLLRNLLDYE